jgi:hypothetical protein
MFGTDLERFFEEQKGGIRVGQARAVSEAEAGLVVAGTGGFVCLDETVDRFFIPIDNPLGYGLVIESPFTMADGTELPGVSVDAGAGGLTVSFPAGMAAGDEGTLHLKIKTAKEGRILYQGDTGVAYFNLVGFTTGLMITFNPASLLPAFDPDADPAVYPVDNAPSTFTMTVTPGTANTGPHAPLIFIDGELRGQGGVSAWPITPAELLSTVTVRVELPHGGASTSYAFRITRTGGEVSLVLDPPAPDKTVYQAGDALDPAGLAAYYSGASLEAVDLADCDIVYDFSKPGPKSVFVTYYDNITRKLLYTAFPAWVVGLNSLSVTGPDDYAPALDLDNFSFSSYDPITHTSVYDLDLGAVPSAVTALAITAASTIEDAELFIGGVKGVSRTVSLDLGPNTIPVTVRVDSASPNIEERTYTLTVYRNPEWYVAPGGNDSNSGTKEFPLRTVAEALARTKIFGAVPGAEFAIIISGNVTADAGTTNGMVDISGTGYPHIILKGASGGGTINASLKGKRVLYIDGGNTVSLGDNLALTGGSVSSGGGCGVYVRDGTFTMTGGAIQGNTGGPGGGGVLVIGGAFTMSSGVIQDNSATTSGGGVYVGGGGTFTMSGGVIQDNSAISGGGVYIINSGSTFIKTGGTITGSDAVLPLLPNSASYSGHTVSIFGNGGNKRDATADPDVNLYTRSNGSTWSYYNPDTDEDTGPNWEP